VRNALVFVLTLLYLGALEKGVGDGSCCAPCSSFCILLLLWWESPDGSFCSFPGYFGFCVSTILFFLKGDCTHFGMYFEFQMLEAAEELICCLD